MAVPRIGEFLFGSRPKLETAQLPAMSPEQAATLRRLLGELGAAGTLEEGGVTPFGGELVAGLGDLEGLSLEALEQKILQRVQGTGPEAEAQTALGRVLRTGGAPVDFEEFFAKSVRDPSLQEFREMILPELTRRYGSSGAFGSDRRLAEQQATERLTKTLAGTRGELAFRTQSAAADRLIQALGLAPGTETASVENLMKLIQGAGLPRSIEQARLTTEYGEFQRQQQQKQQRIAQILAALGLKTTETLGTGLPGSKGLVAGFLENFAGGFGSAAGRGAGGFFGG